MYEQLITDEDKGKFELKSSLTISCPIQANGFSSHGTKSTFTVIFRLRKAHLLFPR